MGLDMYLYTNSKKMAKKLNRPQDGMDDWELYQSDFYRKNGIACYWRKANQIHKWFVDNVQGAKDDCGYYTVHPDQLEDLLATVNKVLNSTRLVEGKVTAGYTYDITGKRVDYTQDGKVLEDTSVAQELLPAKEGFFFGGTEYDEYYWLDLIYTKERLESIIKNLTVMEGRYGFKSYHYKGESDWDITFQYHSSW